MEVLNAGMRKSIKMMAVVCQTARFVSLMPKPKDFVVRVVGDVVYLSAQLNQLSDKMTKMLDSYADIPTNYLMTQVNSITGSLAGITERLNIYGQNAVNQAIGLGEDAVNTITSITGDAIDVAGSLTNAVTSLGNAVSETSANILGQSELSNDIHDATDVILEWTGNGFKNVSENATAPLKKVTQKLADTRTGITDKINEKAENIKNKIEEKQKLVEDLIQELRDKMAKLSNALDTGFKDVTGMTSVANGATLITEELGKYNENKLTTEATTAIASSVATVIKNFSIGKMATAFVGVLTEAAIVRLGLDKLPPIDFESMLCKIRDDLTISNEDLYKQYDRLLESTYKDYIKAGENEDNDDKFYTSKNYDEFMKAYEGELKEQRDTIRTLMKYKDDDKKVQSATERLTKREIKSAIKEVEKYRKQIKNAKQANTYKSILGDELNNFKKEAEYRCNQIKSDWQGMMKQYKDAIAEIKQFFTNGGSCDMFIEDCCKRINQDFDEIKELCKNLASQLICSGIKIVMPADVGPVFPNPVYKISDFWMDIKTIFKFIKDLLTLIIDIINHINKLARIMLNGINDLKEIIQQLMDIIGLRWLMDLIQNIIELFGENIKNAKARLENTLSPVYFSDTKEYENCLDALEDVAEGNKLSDEMYAFFEDMSKNIKSLGYNGDIVDVLYKTAVTTKLKTIGEKEQKAIEEIADELEEQADTIVAYKSPIIEEVGDTANVSDMIDGSSMDNDIKFIGWIFYHPNLNHGDFGYGKGEGTGLINKILKKIKNKIIKKAAKTGHKKRGGVYRLKNIAKVGKLKKRVTAYDAFYWYTYYTEDLEKDCFENNTENNTVIIDSVVQTQNGSIVELNDGRKVFVADNMVRKGDYVTVDGVRYRVGGKNVN